MRAVCSTPTWLIFVLLATQTYSAVTHQLAGNVTRSYTPRGGAESGHVHEFKEQVAMIIVVTNKAENSDRRHRLRTQMHRNLMLLERQASKWPERHRVVFRFVIGTAWLSEELYLGLVAEHDKHGDILFLDIADSDHPDPPPAGKDSACTLKVLHSATWAYEHWRFAYLARVGDDAYFRVDHFLQNVAPTLPKGPLMYGYCFGMRHMYRVAPDIMPVIFPYCSGMGFVMTYDAIEYLARNRHIFKTGYPEDAIVASWFVGTRVRVMHDRRRFHDHHWYVCSNESVLVHKLPPERWAQIDDDGIVASCSPDARPLGH